MSSNRSDHKSQASDKQVLDAAGEHLAAHGEEMMMSPPGLMTPEPSERKQNGMTLHISQKTE